MKTSMLTFATLLGAASTSASELSELDHFEIKAAEPNHIHAEFWDLGYRNKQIGEDTAETLFYDVESGEALFQLSIGKTSSTIQYLDHEPISFKGHHNQGTKEAMAQITSDGTHYARAIGRQALHAHKSFQHIARMALAVGQRGIFGTSHPAAYYLFQLGMKFEQNRRGEHKQEVIEELAPSAMDISLLETESTEVATEGAMALEGADAKMGPLYVAGVAYAWSILKPNRRRRRRRHNGTGMMNYHGFFNNKNYLFSNFSRCQAGYGFPNIGKRQRCFGVCGPGCECWIFICGRCDRIFQGCTEHDCLCMMDCNAGTLHEDSPTDSNASKSGSNRNLYGKLGACNMLNAYQDWGSHRHMAIALCLYTTQHSWWGDGDCEYLTIYKFGQGPHGNHSYGTQQTWGQWNWRIYVWGIGGHFPGEVGRFRKKAKKFSYFLEYSDDFTMPSTWANYANGNGTDLRRWAKEGGSDKNYNGQGYTSTSQSTGINVHSGVNFGWNTHQKWLSDQGIEASNGDYIFIKPYGFQFHPSFQILVDLGYDSFRYVKILDSKSTHVNWPGCGIDSSRKLTGYTAAVDAYMATNGMTVWPHHGYASATTAGSDPIGSYPYANYVKIHGTEGGVENDSSHNLWYYGTGNERATSLDRQIFGGGGNGTTFSKSVDWNTSLQTGAFDGVGANSVGNGNYAGAAPKKKYNHWLGQDNLFSGSFAANIGDQFSVGVEDPSSSDTGCLYNEYKNFPTMPPTKAPNSPPTKHPTPPPTTNNPTEYPTPYPTTSPTENPNWGECCVNKTQGELWLAATSFWVQSYPWTAPSALGYNPWIHHNGAGCDTLTTMHTCRDPLLNAWYGWVGSPNSILQDPFPGCEWIAMGGVGNAKCPHKTSGAAVQPQGGIPNNSFSTTSGSGFNGPAGLAIPAPGSPQSYQFAVASNNNVNVMGVTFANSENEGYVSKGAWVSKVSEEIVNKDGNVVGYLRPNEDKQNEREVAAPTFTPRGDAPGHSDRYQVNDHGKQDEVSIAERASKDKFEAWRTSGEANYPFYTGMDGSGEVAVEQSTHSVSAGTEGKPKGGRATSRRG